METINFKKKNIIDGWIIFSVICVVKIRTEYGVSQELGCDVLYKEDIELILIYNKDSFVIDSVFARRVR